MDSDSARDEFARRYIMYVEYGDTDNAYFWWVAYCFGKRQAIIEFYGPKGLRGLRR